MRFVIAFFPASRAFEGPVAVALRKGQSAAGLRGLSTSVKPRTNNLVRLGW